MRKNYLSSLFIRLMSASDSRLSLILLNWIFRRKLGFNAPHKFKIVELGTDHVKVCLPFIKVNTNHLGTVHACAMATIGEFTAGLSLMKNFSPLDFRLIMKDLKIEFVKQGTTNLTASIKLSEDELHSFYSEIELNRVSEPKLISLITNEHGELVAKAYTSWQLKAWENTKFRAS